jgi:hypothetical protein
MRINFAKISLIGSVFGGLAMANACTGTSPQQRGFSPSAGCGVGNVQAETSAAEVLASCGEPQYRDAWGATEAARGPDLAAVEEWYYNSGAGRDVQVLRFLNGRLVEVHADGNGFGPGRSAQACSRSHIGPGLSKYRLVSACGEPITRQAYIVDPSYITPNAPVLSQGNAIIVGQSQNAKPSYREELAFRIDGAVRMVTLENGRILSLV